MLKKFLLYFSFCCFCCTFVSAQILSRPQPARLVNDYTSTLSAQQQQQLEYTLDTFAKATSNQICIVIVPDLNGYDIAQYAVELGHLWGVGQEKFDNGIVILLKPKTGNSRGEVFIAAGYGLEGVVPDATAKYIVEYVMIPYFQQNNYYGGINAAVDYLIPLVKGEINSPVADKKMPTAAIVIFIVCFVIFIIFIASTKNKYKGNGTYSSSGGWIFLPPMSGGSGRSYSSGSGFGGFGGGSFGGGGAGGSW